MEFPECLNGWCTYNEEYRCKAEGISEDIICQQGKDGTLFQVNESKSGDVDSHDMITEEPDGKIVDNKT